LFGVILMTSIWRQHLIIYLFLGLLAIPIYFMDLVSTSEGDPQLDHTGFPGTNLLDLHHIVAIYVALSSLGVVPFPTSGALRIHFWSMVLSVILLVMAVAVYGKLLRAQFLYVASRAWSR
jgi:hypothetical protein